MQNDLRLVEISKRETADMGIKQTISVLLAVAILLIVGLYTYVKVGSATSPLNGGAYGNSSYYCTDAGVANLTDNTCLSGTRTPFTTDSLANYNSWLNLKTNARSAFDLGSVIPIVMGAAAIIGLLYLAFA